MALSSGIITGLLGYRLSKEFLGDSALFYRETEVFNYEIYAIPSFLQPSGFSQIETLLKNEFAELKAENDRLQIAIFNVVALDIGQALMSEESASKTAAECLGKLEKAGFSRQTVAKAFTLEDFYRIGKQAGVPDIAKPWLKEFHESIALKEVAEPVRTAADPGAAARPVNGTSGHVAGNGAAGPAVAAGGSKSPGPRPRAQSRDRSKNL